MTPKQRVAMEQALAYILATSEHDQLCDVLDLDDEGCHKSCTCGLEKTLAALRAALAENQLDDIDVVDMAAPAEQEADRLAALGWQAVDCPVCGSSARAFPKPAEQEPVGYRQRLPSGEYAYCKTAQFFDNPEPIYTAPQPAKQPLTDEEIDVAIQLHVDPVATYRKLHNFARAVIAAYERKNGIKEGS